MSEVVFRENELVIYTTKNREASISFGIILSEVDNYNVLIRDISTWLVVNHEKAKVLKLSEAPRLLKNVPADVKEEFSNHVSHFIGVRGELSDLVNAVSNDPY